MDKQKILCVRVDRIGDLVLTLPADQYFQNQNVTWLINDGLGFIPEHAIPKRNYKEIKKTFSFAHFFALINWLKNEKFAQVLFFHAPWWVSLAAFVSRIPVRAGRKSQWHSYLFLNRGFRQSRIAGEKSELEFNFELASQLSEMKLKNSEQLSLKIQPAANNKIIDELSLKPKSFIVVHAGMSGSARNWSIENYASLIFKLSKKYRIVLTGTSSDSKWLKPLRAQLQKYHFAQENIEISSVIWTDEKLNAQELICVLANASCVLAPSTGVIHLAASTGVPVVGLYSPVKSQNSKRWGPKGAEVVTLTPQVDCPATKSCLMSQCSKYDCMELLTVETVLDEIRKKIEVQ